MLDDNCVGQSLGINIRALRYQKNISQSELSKLSGLHRTYIGVVERGEKNITVVNCFKVAHALGLALSELIGMVEASMVKEQHLREEANVPASHGSDGVF